MLRSRGCQELVCWSSRVRPPIARAARQQVEFHCFGKMHGPLGHSFAELGQFLPITCLFPSFPVHQQFRRFTIALEADTDPSFMLT